MKARAAAARRYIGDCRLQTTRKLFHAPVNASGKISPTQFAVNSLRYIDLMSRISAW